MSTSSQDNAVLEPHLSDIDRGSGSRRYPNPFFDLAQQYIPRTVKELFRWCTYFYHTHPLIGATISKISRYPITDLILEDADTRVVDGWKYIFNDQLHIKDRLMEMNLDLNVYGNCFASIHLPFTRFLVCSSCHTSTNIKDVAWKWSNFKFNFRCPSCKSMEQGDPADPKTIRDVPYRSKEDIKIIRWNPENMAICYNEATGTTHYFYNMSPALRHQINSGERDIIEELPLLFLLAVKKSRLIKMSNSNLFHLKRPTLAEKDIGWGKPLIQHVLRDLYYMATLRRAQEAIAQEHIVPFDFLYPQPNAQMDPFVHTDLGNWKNRVEEVIRNRRRDPNYKAVLPVPIGFGRLGGDGKALMLTPELNVLQQQIVGGMGIPQEFLFGGCSNWTGSSITLRSLQNDFQHNQSQLLDFTRWVKEKIRLFLRIPDIKTVRFMDFKMADDIQRIQQLISLNAQRKVSDETMLTELGLDYEKETKKIVEEMQVQNQIQDLMARAQAKTSGEAQIISWNYQQKIQELAQKSQEKQMAQQPPLMDPAQQGMGPYGGEQSNLGPPAAEGQQPLPGQGGAGGVAPEDGGPQHQQLPEPQAALQPGYQEQAGQDIPGATPAMSGGGQVSYLDVHKTVKSWATKLTKMNPTEAQKMLVQVKQQMPQFGDMVEKAYNEMLGQNAMATASGGGGGTAAQASPGGAQPNMNPLPSKGAPTRAGSV